MGMGWGSSFYRDSIVGKNNPVVNIGSETYISARFKASLMALSNILDSLVCWRSLKHFAMTKSLMVSGYSINAPHYR